MNFQNLSPTNIKAFDTIAIDRVPLHAQSYSGQPISTDFASVQAGEDKIVVASNGLFLNHSNTWISTQFKIAQPCASFSPPYGKADEFVKINLPKVPDEICRAVLDHFRSACPLEAACLISFNQQTKEYSLHFPHVIRATGAHISYRYPDLDRFESLVIDIHSHGLHKAFFSSTDQTDDHGSTKISMVIGNLNQDEVSIASKIMVRGVELAQIEVCEILSELITFQ